MRFPAPEPRAFGTLQAAAAPQVVHGRDHDQRENRGGDHPPHHRRRNPLHDFRTGAVAPECRQQAEHDRGHSHELGPEPVHRAVFNRPNQLVAARAPASLGDIGPGVVEVEQHDHAGLRRDAGEGDEPDGDRDREVVIQQPYHPDAADQREGQGKHDDQHLGDAAEGEIEQQRDHGQRQRHHHLEPGLHPLQGHVLGWGDSVGPCFSVLRISGGVRS